MDYYSSQISKLIEELSRLPGIGAKTAQRLAFHIINMPKEQVEQLAGTMTQARNNVRYCKQCFSLTDQELCPICSNTKRDSKTIMVVETSRDLAAYEKTGKYEGVYHVLHGAISPMLGIGPGDIKLKELMERLRDDVDEVIVATNSSLEGETTAMYISKLIKPIGIKVSLIASGVPVHVATVAEDDFKLTPEKLEAVITPKSKLLVLPYPNNPTGAILEKNELEALAKIIIKHDLMVISDEIYSELTYGAKHVSIASIDGMRERTIVVNGFSKSYAMTGWRLGYACCPREIAAVMTRIHQYGIMSAPTMAQFAAVEALNNGDRDIEEMREEYTQRRRFMCDRFNAIGLTCAMPQGAFYMFPCIKSTGLTSDEFCMRLLQEKHVAVIPGNAFGESGEGFVRCCYAASMKNIAKALSRIEEFVQSL